MKILYDGWPLVYGGNDPAAIHLLTLLAAHPAEIPTEVALPGEPFHALPGGIDVMIEATPESVAGRLRWEQDRLPALARRAEASHIHTVGGLALFGAASGVFSPAGAAASAERPVGFTARLASALAQGGAARTRAWLWPNDLPADGSVARSLPPSARYLLPPVVHPAFTPVGSQTADTPTSALASFDLPETYILVHAPGDTRSIRRVLDAWSWAAGSIGVDYPLLWVGLKEPEQDVLAVRLAEYGLTGAARPLPPVPLPALAELYRCCSAMLHLGDIAPWGDPARLVLACGRPLAAYETPASAALVGPAAYLAASDHQAAEGARQSEARSSSARALGAALLTIIVEEGLAEGLAQAARERSAAWSFERFRTALRELYATF